MLMPCSLYLGYILGRLHPFLLLLVKKAQEVSILPMYFTVGYQCLYT